MVLYRAHNAKAITGRSGQFDNPYAYAPRRPLTMPLVTHAICGSWFEARYKANFRESAVFCTGSIEQANAYLGAESVLIRVWPIDEYRLCYSYRVRDLFEHLKCGSFSGNANNESEVYSELDSLGYCVYENCGIEQAAASGSEVMLLAGKYGYEILE